MGLQKPLFNLNVQTQLSPCTANASTHREKSLLSLSVTSAARRRSFKVVLRSTHLNICLIAKSFDAISTVESHSNLLICINESLKLCVQLNILSGKNVTVMLKSIGLGTHVCVLTLQRLGGKTKIILLASLGG